MSNTNKDIIGEPCKHKRIPFSCEACDIESLKQQLATAKQEKEILKVAFDNLTSSTKEWYDMYANLKASLPKVRADAVRKAVKKTQTKSYSEDYFGHITEYNQILSQDILSHADKLEAGNE